MQYAGEYTIEQLDLFPSSGVGAIDLRQNFLDINLYESIFSSSVSGTIKIATTDELVANFPIVGQEFLTLKLSTPASGGKTIDFTQSPLLVYKVIGDVKLGNSGKIITLRFASPEIIRNYRVRVSKSYKDTTSNIVKDLMGESHIDTNKKLFVESSSGVRKLICPNVHPFQFIKKLTRESLSIESGSPHYLFFENCDGYHFRTLQSLYGGDQGGNIVRKLHDGEVDVLSARRGRIQDTFNTMISHDIHTANDMIGRTTTGMLGSKVVVHDIFNKSYQTTTFNYLDEFDKFGRTEGRTAGDNPLYSDGAVDRFGNNVSSFADSKLHLHPTSNVNDRFDAQHYEQINRDGVDINRNPYMSNRVDMWLLSRQSRFVELLDGISISMQIYGDTNIRAGDMIKLGLSNPLSDDGIDASTSGDYLISNLRHHFVNTETPMHFSFVGAVRDSRPDKVKDGSQVEPKQNFKFEEIQVNSQSTFRP